MGLLSAIYFPGGARAPSGRNYRGETSVRMSFNDAAVRRRRHYEAQLFVVLFARLASCVQSFLESS